MRKVIHCPLTQLPIPVIVGSDKEMLLFMKKQNNLGAVDVQELHQRLLTCDGMVAETKYNGYDTWIVFFKKDDNCKGVTYNVAAHEAFHLWGNLTSYIYGNDIVQYHIDADEQCAYHFGKLFNDLTKVVAEADEKSNKKKSKKEILFDKMIESMKKDEEVNNVTTESFGETQTESIESTIDKINEQNEIESEGIPFIAIDGTDKTAEEILDKLRNKKK